MYISVKKESYWVGKSFYDWVYSFRYNTFSSFHFEEEQIKTKSRQWQWQNKSEKASRQWGTNSPHASCLCQKVSSNWLGWQSHESLCFSSKLWFCFIPWKQSRQAQQECRRTCVSWCRSCVARIHCFCDCCIRTAEHLWNWPPTPPRTTHLNPGLQTHETNTLHFSPETNQHLVNPLERKVCHIWAFQRAFAFCFAWGTSNPNLTCKFLRSSGTDYTVISNQKQQWIILLSLSKFCFQLKLTACQLQDWF